MASTASVRHMATDHTEVDMTDTYKAPLQGWTCFHCGETFTTAGAAQDHFGVVPSADPACRIKVGEERGLVMALRKLEAERDELQVRLTALRVGADEADCVERFHATRGTAAPVA